MESWAGPGNEATRVPLPAKKWPLFVLSVSKNYWLFSASSKQKWKYGPSIHSHKRLPVSSLDWLKIKLNARYFCRKNFSIFLNHAHTSDLWVSRRLSLPLMWWRGTLNFFVAISLKVYTTLLDPTITTALKKHWMWVSQHMFMVVYCQHSWEGYNSDYVGKEAYLFK